MSTKEFVTDRRAIEGLPVRLVIALVVGVASLSVMLNMLSGVQGLAVSELDVRPSPEVTTPGEQTVSLAVVDADGTGVENATVVLRGDALDGVVTARTGEGGVATANVNARLGPNRAEGAIEVSIKPPATGNYVDQRSNTEILVVDG